MEKFTIILSNSKRYIRRIKASGETSFHKYKTQTHKWGDKYGTYNVKTQTAGSATFYNIGKEEIKLQDYKEITDIDIKAVALGFNY